MNTKWGVVVRLERKKVALSMARACMDIKDLAVAANMPRPTLCGVLAGRGARLSTIGKIAKALGVDVADIVDDEEG